MHCFIRLYAHGGEDIPEKCMSGLMLAIEASRPGSTLYVITDAPAKDFRLQVSQIVLKTFFCSTGTLYDKLL